MVLLLAILQSSKMVHKLREILECALFCFSENKNKKDPLNQEKIFFVLFSFHAYQM